MKVNNKKETVVFEDLKYGDVFSFYQFGDKTVYIKIRDSTDKMKSKEQIVNQQKLKQTRQVLKMMIQVKKQ